MEQPERPSVVVVDDDNMVREMLKLILRSGDYPVVGEASNGREAVALCSKLKPGLVLLDINMPKMDGSQALREIRRASPATIVLMMSRGATMGNFSEAIEKGAAGFDGAVGFLVKPLNPANVLDRIAMCLKNNRRG